MMEFLRFIFSDFWIWLGFICLIYTVLDKLAEIIKAGKSNKSVHVYESPVGKTITVDNATEEDIRKALNGALSDAQKEETDHD